LTPSFVNAPQVTPDCLRAVISRLWEFWGKGPGATSTHRLGHICTVETAKKIQSSGVIKAQKSKDRRSVACFFFDFKDFVSILKGFRSLWKHIATESAQARWGFFVQKPAVNLADHGIKFETKWGANWVYASIKDVRAELFDYFIVPPALPFAAFRVSQFWGRPAMQWAALSNHGILLNTLKNDIDLHEDIVTNVKDMYGHPQRTDLGSKNLQEPYRAVVPTFNEEGAVTYRRARSLKDVDKNIREISRCWAKIFDLEERYSDVQGELELSNGLLQLSRDINCLKGFDRGAACGWGDCGAAGLAAEEGANAADGAAVALAGLATYHMDMENDDSGNDMDMENDDSGNDMDMENDGDFDIDDGTGMGNDNETEMGRENDNEMDIENDDKNEMGIGNDNEHEKDMENDDKNEMGIENDNEHEKDMENDDKNEMGIENDNEHEKDMENDDKNEMGIENDNEHEKDMENDDKNEMGIENDNEVGSCDKLLAAKALAAKANKALYDKARRARRQAKRREKRALEKEGAAPAAPTTDAEKREAARDKKRAYDASRAEARNERRRIKKKEVRGCYEAD
jgi:hypothetical protein